MHTHQAIADEMNKRFPECNGGPEHTGAIFCNLPNKQTIVIGDVNDTWMGDVYANRFEGFCGDNPTYTVDTGLPRTSEDAPAIVEKIVIELLSREFAHVLCTWLTVEEMRQVNLRNPTPAYKGCCASHDFCDANMAMDEAFHNFGMSLGDDPDDVHRFDLWNHAWDLAKANNFWS